MAPQNRHTRRVLISCFVLLSLPSFQALLIKNSANTGLLFQPDQGLHTRDLPATTLSHIYRRGDVRYAKRLFRRGDVNYKPFQLDTSPEDMEDTETSSTASGSTDRTVTAANAGSLSSTRKKELSTLHAKRVRNGRGFYLTILQYILQQANYSRKEPLVTKN